MWRLACALVVLIVASGCKNQTTGQYTNPFLTPDRVPPPSTRVLAPGTAQPYYPGDPAPGAAPPTGAPVIGAPTIGTPVPGYPSYPTSGATPPLTTPPGGWGGTTYPPQSSTGVGGDAVSVPGDQQNLRFGEGAQFASNPITPTPMTPNGSVPGFNAFAAAPPATMRMPIQSMLPLNGEQAAPQQLQTREVTAAEYFAPSGFTSGVQHASAQVPTDGFRPQGSVPRARGEEASQGFQPPAITRAGVSGGSDGAQFATGENFESLRGQLEYWPETGAWSLRYLGEGAAVDTLGGRVMIENPQVLANLPPGEFVTVRGQLFGQPADDGTMSAMYRVSAVQRQRQ